MRRISRVSVSPSIGFWSRAPWLIVTEPATAAAVRTAISESRSIFPVVAYSNTLLAMISAVESPAEDSLMSWSAANSMAPVVPASMLSTSMLAPPITSITPPAAVRESTVKSSTSPDASRVVCVIAMFARLSETTPLVIEFTSVFSRTESCAEKASEPETSKPGSEELFVIIPPATAES